MLNSYKITRVFVVYLNIRSLSTENDAVSAEQRRGDEKAYALVPINGIANKKP